MTTPFQLDLENDVTHLLDEFQFRRQTTEEQTGLVGLREALEGLPNEELQRLSTLPIEKLYDELVGGVVVPNRATRRRRSRT